MTKAQGRPPTSSSIPTWTGAITLPDGSAVRGRGVRYHMPEGPEPDFGLYLGVDFEPTWPHDWVAWPNYGLPRDALATAHRIEGIHRRALDGQRVEVACLGGRGRTGTVIACMAILSGLKPEHAVSWVRRHHDHRAVQTPWQRHWVRHYTELLER